jgi:hypothetical protein
LELLIGLGTFCEKGDLFLWFDEYEQKAWALSQCKKSGRKDEKIVELINNDRASLFIYCCLIRQLPSFKKKLGSDLLHLLIACSKISHRKMSKLRLKRIMATITSKLKVEDSYCLYGKIIIPKNKNVYYEILKILDKISKY